MEHPQQEQPINHIDRLTDRELEIIELMQAGLSNKEIARQMSLAYETIKWYTKRIYSKLQVKNRNQLISHLNESRSALNNAAPSKQPGRWASPLTAFIGRSAEKRALLEEVSNKRLVTLLGPGGIGKTRLALEIGRLAPDQLKRNSFLISAEPFHSTSELIFSLADLFKISLNNYDSPINQIGSGLPSTPMLIIIDNFESINESAPALITLLEKKPALNILVTSRSALRLNAESIFRLDGLIQDQNNLNRNEAADLFRARAHKGLEKTSLRENQTEINEICQLVGGSPLAIELAASWTRSLTCKQIVAELKNGLKILTSDAADIELRHRSIEAICEQSWLTLKPVERRAALKLALFESRFTWEAAREIGSISLQTITTLLDQSIIRRVPGGRLSMHAVLRRFIQQQSGRVKFDSTQTQKRFTTFYIQHLVDLGADIHSSKQIEALNGIEQELDHILQAWRWAAQTNETAILKDALEPLALFFEVRDHSKQGSTLFAETLAQLPNKNEFTAGLLLFQGWHEIWLGNTEGGSAAMFQAVEQLDCLGCRGAWPLPISMLSFNEQFSPEVRSMLEQRYLVDRGNFLRQGNKHGAAWMAYGLGNITRPTEAFDRSTAHFKESLKLFQAQQDYYGVSYALDGLSTTLSRMGALDEAWEVALQLKATSIQLGNMTHLAVTAEMFGQISEKRGDYQAAFGEYLDGLRYGVINTNATNIIPHLFHLGRLIADHDLASADTGVILLTLVQSHPYSQAGWFAFRQKECQEWLNVLQERMNREDYLSAIVAGKNVDLLDGAKQFLESI